MSYDRTYNRALTKAKYASENGDRSRNHGTVGSGNAGYMDNFKTTSVTEKKSYSIVSPRQRETGSSTYTKDTNINYPPYTSPLRQGFSGHRETTDGNDSLFAIKAQKQRVEAKFADLKKQFAKSAYSTPSPKSSSYSARDTAGIIAKSPPQIGRYAPIPSFTEKDLIDSCSYKEVEEQSDPSVYSKLEKEKTRKVYASPRGVQDDESYYSRHSKGKTRYNSVSPSSGRMIETRYYLDDAPENHSTRNSVRFGSYSPRRDRSSWKQPWTDQTVREKMRYGGSTSPNKELNDSGFCETPYYTSATSRRSRIDSSPGRSPRRRLSRSPRLPDPWEELDNYDYYNELMEKPNEPIKSQLKRAISEPVYVDPPEYRDEPYYSQLCNERNMYNSSRRVPPEESLLPPYRPVSNQSARPLTSDVLVRELTPRTRSNSLSLERSKSTPYDDSGYYSPRSGTARSRGLRRDVTFSVPDVADMRGILARPKGSDLVDSSYYKEIDENNEDSMYSKLERESSREVYNSPRDSVTTVHKKERTRYRSASPVPSGNRYGTLPTQQGHRYRSLLDSDPYHATKRKERSGYRSVSPVSSAERYQALPLPQKDAYSSPRYNREKKKQPRYHSVSPPPRHARYRPLSPQQKQMYTSIRDGGPLPLSDEEVERTNLMEKRRDLAFNELMKSIDSLEAPGYMETPTYRENLYSRPHAIHSRYKEPSEDLRSSVFQTPQYESLSSWGISNPSDSSDLSEDDLDELPYRPAKQQRHNRLGQGSLRPPPQCNRKIYQPHMEDNLYNPMSNKTKALDSLSDEEIDEIIRSRPPKYKDVCDDSGFVSFQMDNEDNDDRLNKTGGIRPVARNGNDLVSLYEQAKQAWRQHNSVSSPRQPVQSPATVTEVHKSSLKKTQRQTQNTTTGSKTETEMSTKYREEHVTSPRGMKLTPRLMDDVGTDDGSRLRESRLRQVPPLPLNSSDNSQSMEDAEESDSQMEGVRTDVYGSRRAEGIDSPVLKSRDALLSDDIELADWQEDYLADNTKTALRRVPDSDATDATYNVNMSEEVASQPDRESSRTASSWDSMKELQTSSESLQLPEDIYHSHLPVMGKEQLQSTSTRREPKPKIAPIRKIPQKAVDSNFVMVPMSEMKLSPCLFVPKRLCRSMAMENQDMQDLAEGVVPGSLKHHLSLAGNESKKHSAHRKRSKERHHHHRPTASEEEAAHQSSYHPVRPLDLQHVGGQRVQETVQSEEEVTKTSHSPRATDPLVLVERTVRKRTKKTRTVNHRTKS